MTWTGDAEESKERTIIALMADRACAMEDLTLKLLRSPNSGPACVTLAIDESIAPVTVVETS